MGRIKEGTLAPKTQISFDIGEQVKVCEGPFASFSGLVEEIDEEIISTGILGELNFRALASGETELNFFNQECKFYNSLGEIIDIPDLEFENISIRIN